VTRLRQKMLEELQRRNYAKSTIRHYLRVVADFSRHFGKSPDKLNPDHLRSYQAYLLTVRKLAVESVVASVAALRFFYVRTLKRPEFREDLPYPKRHRRNPTVLSQDEVAKIINAATTLMQRALLMVLYGTGMRRSEIAMMKVSNIDSSRMSIHVEFAKGGNQRFVPLSPVLLETLREYWRWKRPKEYLFPCRRSQTGKIVPISDKTVYYTCVTVARRAGIKKKVTPHMMRHTFATHMLENGTDIRRIQEILGHGDLRTTARYLHISQRHLQNIVNPLDSLPLSPVDKI
jgi:integrase/recombinase XerD